MKYLIIGHKGQLGKEFTKHFDENNILYDAVDIDELDISDFSAVMDIFSRLKPDIVFNCAAFNLVDVAEKDPEDAIKVNANGPKYLAHAVKKHHSFLVHYSTDYVYDGKKTDGLYTEEDQTAPVNEYGKSKLLGEKYIKYDTNDSLIFRLSWVFGEGNQNFIYKMNEWTKDNKVLNISFDEISVPTYTKVIVDVTLKALNNGLIGTYNLTNGGYASRYEWAKLINKQLNREVLMLPVNQSYFNLPAIRPYFSAMSNAKISELLNISIPSWEESVIEFIAENYNPKK